MTGPEFEHLEYDPAIDRLRATNRQERQPMGVAPAPFDPIAGPLDLQRHRDAAAVAVASEDAASGLGGVAGVDTEMQRPEVCF
jgi:hypothetical protein